MLASAYRRLAISGAGSAMVSHPGRTKAARVRKGLAFIKSLDRTEANAFLGLFAGARFPWTIYDGGYGPCIGKHECEMVEDWRDFYSKRLVDAGLFFWSEGESGPALGMVRKKNGDYHTWMKIDCGPTNLGWDVREAWWTDWRKAVERSDAEYAASLPSPIDRR